VKQYFKKIERNNKTFLSKIERNNKTFLSKIERNNTLKNRVNISLKNREKQ
jgi:hypothetical protein